MERKPQGFFAYSSIPASSGEAIESAVREINSLKEVDIFTWPRIARGGNLVIDDILTCIERSDFVCFDLTGMNDNVLFELGFAIARKKPIWIIFDTSYEESQRKWNLLGLLQDITYVGYHNNHDIVRKFNEEKPHNSQEIFSRLIQLYVIPDSQPEILLYLKQQIQTTASGVIDYIIEDRQVPVVLDDPTESKVQTLAWYIQNIYNCIGVLSELSSSERSGYALQNMKCSFVSGLAKGMEKLLYMVAEQPYNPPSDYRSIVNKYSRIDKIERNLRSFLNDVKSEAVKQLTLPKPKQQVLRKKK